MIRSALLSCLLLIAGVSSLPAATVDFIGVVTSANNGLGFLGTIPPNRNFSGRFFVTDGAGPNAPITSGYFNFGSGLVLNVNGGNVTVNSALNQVQFTALPTTPQPTVTTFTFTTAPGELVGNAVNQGQLNKLVGLSTTTLSIVDLTFGTSYGGSITAVPEPASMLAVSGLVVGFGGWRMRRKWLKAKANA